MANALLKYLVRLRFQLTSRRGADALIEHSAKKYRLLTETFDEDSGRKSVRVPPMLGVDEDMLDWSFYMILEHNVIVNDAMRRVVQSLSEGVELQAEIDPKHDVMPGENPGPEQVEAFLDSIENYQLAVAKIPRLRGTMTRQHPVFDRLDAHGWHCMFGLHLELHRKQAEAVARLV